MSNDSDDHSLILSVHGLPATANLVRRGLDLAAAVAPIDHEAAWREFEMLGDTIAGGTVVVLSLSELSPQTLPRLLDRDVTSVMVGHVLIDPGSPLTETQPILDLRTEQGVYIEFFSTWCDGWPLPGQRPTIGRVKDVKVKAGDTITVGQPILTAEFTSNETVEKVIAAAARAAFHDSFVAWETIYNAWGGRKFVNDNLDEITKHRAEHPGVSWEAATEHVLSPKKHRGED